MKRREVVVALVLVAAAAGAGAWWLRTGLTAAVERSGGAVVDEPDTPYGRVVSVVYTARPVGDADLHFLRGRRGFQRLMLDSTRVKGDCLADLADASDLRWLSLRGCPVTDAGLAHLPALPELELINLENTRITDAGLEHLRKLTGLRQLFLDNTAVTDGGLEHLRGLNQLAELEVTKTGVTAEGVRRLKEALPGLKKVYVGPPG
jgi:hypothetical protein